MEHVRNVSYLLVMRGRSCPALQLRSECRDLLSLWGEGMGTLLPSTSEPGHALLDFTQTWQLIVCPSSTRTHRPGSWLRSLGSCRGEASPPQRAAGQGLCRGGVSQPGVLGRKVPITASTPGQSPGSSERGRQSHRVQAGAGSSWAVGTAAPLQALPMQGGRKVRNGFVTLLASPFPAPRKLQPHFLTFLLNAVWVFFYRSRGKRIFLWERSKSALRANSSKCCS